MSKGNIVVSVSDVSKTFNIPLEASNGIKQKMINHLKGRKGYREFSPLNGISFTINEGDFFGIVGRNGSGKSTLLKTIAGIYAPTKGSVDVNGSLVPFIELGVGFNPELTGRENVYLNGALLGFSRNEMEAMYDDIVSFAELHDFMDERLKNYSSGMQVRLAFSIAIRAKGDILLLDEVLAVGDAAFQKKCFDYFMKLKKEKKTVILVTHDMSAVRKYCNRAIMIDGGKIVESGKVEKVAQAYQKLFNDEITHVGSNIVGDDKRWGSGKLKAAIPKLNISDQDISIEVTYKAEQPIDAPVFGFNIYNSRGMNVLEGNTIRANILTRTMERGESATICWNLPNILATDTYTLSVSCCDQSITEFYDWYNEAVTFIVSKDGNTAGFVDPTLTVAPVKYMKR
jgi:ABC-2 type transport system ATP-binding protein